MQAGKYIASLIAATLLMSAPAMGQDTAARRVVDVDAPHATDLPRLSADELDQLVGAIALYPDPLTAQILPASTYPLDIVRAARMVREGASDAQIDEQNWDPSVKAIAHYPTVLELMDSNLDWTQQLGQAFVAQPEDVLQSIQRLRQRARALGNLTTTPQQQVLVEESSIYIVPANPTILYVPVYQPEIVYYERPVFEPYITFGIGCSIGVWFDLEFDWGHHYISRPGWTWNHWHDFMDVDRDRITHIRRPEFRPEEREHFVWRRDERRPLVLPGRRISQPSDFDQFRGRDNHQGEHPQPSSQPRHIETPRPVPDRGRTPQPNAPRPGQSVNPLPPGSDVRRYQDRGHDSLGQQPRPTPNPSPAPHQQPGPAPSRPPTPAPTPAPTRPANPAPVPNRPTPAPSRPSTPPSSRPAHIPSLPSKVTPPPATRPATGVPFTGRPAAPQPPSGPSKDDGHHGHG